MRGLAVLPCKATSTRRYNSVCDRSLSDAAWQGAPQRGCDWRLQHAARKQGPRNGSPAHTPRTCDVTIYQHPKKHTVARHSSALRSVLLHVTAVPSEKGGDAARVYSADTDKDITSVMRRPFSSPLIQGPPPRILGPLKRIVARHSSALRSVLLHVTAVP